MRSMSRSVMLAAVVATGVCAGAAPASAKCQRMHFSVNDFGKEGPTRDAKDLLDKHIADWAKKNAIKKYTVGKKDVKCELYLNLIVVDEHTCKASALVCWGDDVAPDAASPAPPATKAPAAKPPAPAKKPKSAASG